MKQSQINLGLTLELLGQVGRTSEIKRVEFLRRRVTENMFIFGLKKIILPYRVILELTPKNSKDNVTFLLNSLFHFGIFGILFLLPYRKSHCKHLIATCLGAIQKGSRTIFIIALGGVIKTLKISQKIGVILQHWGLFTYCTWLIHKIHFTAHFFFEKKEN